MTVFSLIEITNKHTCCNPYQVYRKSIICVIKMEIFSVVYIEDHNNRFIFSGATVVVPLQ